MARMVVILVMGLMLGCATASGQRPLGITPGQEARVTVSDSTERMLSGNVVGIDQQELTLDTESFGRLSVPLGDVVALAVKVGRKRNPGRGALVGLGTGLVAFFAIDLAEGGCDPSESLCEAGRAAGFAVLVGGGLVAGTLVGLAVETDQWEAVPLPLQVVVRPRRGRLSVGWSVPVAGK